MVGVGKYQGEIWIYGCFQKIGGKPPKWMVKIIEIPIKMDDLGCFPPIFGSTPIFSDWTLWISSFVCFLISSSWITHIPAALVFK